MPLDGALRTRARWSFDRGVHRSRARRHSARAEYPLRPRRQRLAIIRSCTCLAAQTADRGSHTTCATRKATARIRSRPALTATRRPGAAAELAAHIRVTSLGRVNSRIDCCSARSADGTGYASRATAGGAAGLAAAGAAGRSCSTTACGRCRRTAAFAATVLRASLVGATGSLAAAGARHY